MIAFTPDQCKRIGEMTQRLASVGFDSVTGHYEIQRGDVKITAQVVNGNVNFMVIILKRKSSIKNARNRDRQKGR